MSSTTVSGPGSTPIESLASNPPDENEPDIFAPEVEAVLDELVAEGLVEVVTEELFDAGSYRIETPTFDNLASDKLILSLGGPLELDATNPDDLALWENFMLGKSVSLLVHGSVVGKTGSYKENADGEVTVTGKAAVKIHSLTLQNG